MADAYLEGVDVKVGGKSCDGDIILTNCNMEQYTSGTLHTTECVCVCLPGVPGIPGFPLSPLSPLEAGEKE